MFLLAFTWLLHVQAAEALHLTPLALRRIRAMAIAMPMLPGLGLLGLAIARRIEWRGVVSLVATLGLSLVGAGFLAIGGHFELFDSEELELSVESADGLRQAHVFRKDGLLSCHRVVYVSERGATYALVAEVGASMDCSKPGAPGVAWLSDGGAALTVDGGALAEPLHLFFGPH